MNTLSFYNKVKQQIEVRYQDINIDLYVHPLQPTKLLYSYSPNPQLSIPELRHIVEVQNQPNIQESQLLASKIIYFLNNLIRILQNNEQCRLNWTIGIHRGRFQSQNKMNLTDLQQELSSLNQLIQQCKHGVTCKSELKNILDVKRKAIFLWNDDTKFVRNIKEIILPEMPEIISSYKLLNEDTYLILYQSIIQRLLIYQNAMNQYIQNRLSFLQFQQICSELMRQDILFGGSSKANQLINYCWHFCNTQLQKFNRLRSKIFNLRSKLINSTLRIYYVCLMAKLDIQQLYQSLIPIQNYLMQSINFYSQKNGINLGRNSKIVEVNEDKIISLQVTFEGIFSFLTDDKEKIFINIYERKLRKRVYRLTEIQNRLTHLYKIKFNPDYAQHVLNTKLAHPIQHNNFNIEDNLKKLTDYYSQTRPLNDNQFRMVFEQLQRIASMRNHQKSQNNQQQQYKILQFEKIILNDYLFDDKGQRKFKNQMTTHKFNKSVASEKNKVNNLNQYEVKREQVFQETIDQLNRNGYYQMNRNQLGDFIDANSIYAEGREYLVSIRPEFGQEFMDLLNFRVYILPKIQKKTQIALSQTNYSVQPLFLQLTSLLQNLNLVIQMIRPDINQKKIDLIFFPKVNASLFTVLKIKMLQHQQKLSNIYVQLRQNAIKANTLQPNVKLFIENRLRYLYVLLENIDKLQQIAIHIGQLNLVKNSYDITSQNTYNIILRLLLAQKQIKAYQSSLRDKLNDKTMSQKAIRLLSQYIYPNFINSLLIVFQSFNKTNPSQALQNLLNVAQQSQKLVAQSDRSLNEIIKISEAILRKQLSRNIIQALQSFKIFLYTYFNKAQLLINQANTYNHINSQALAVLRLRIFQFMQLCEYGPHLKSQILDQRSKYLLNILKSIGL